MLLLLMLLLRLLIASRHVPPAATRRLAAHADAPFLRRRALVITAAAIFVVGEVGAAPRDEAAAAARGRSRRGERAFVTPKAAFALVVGVGCVRRALAREDCQPVETIPGRSDCTARICTAPRGHDVSIGRANA
jgi:hypothetical protein